MQVAFAPEITRLLRTVPSHATGAVVVRTDAIRRNYRTLRDLAPAAETAAVVKADAYGLGAKFAVPALEKEECRSFFVATLEEAEALRCISERSTVYVLDGLLPGTASRFEGIEARPVLGNLGEIAEWAEFCYRAERRFPAAVHFDTGMTRLGLPYEDTRCLAEDNKTLASFQFSLAMSHLACADDPSNGKNEAQQADFEALSPFFPGVRRSLANSAGILLGSKYHFDVTRPGIFLFGGRPTSLGANRAEPVVSLYGRIAQLRWAEPGETVGYGGAYTLQRRTRIATVCAGYADGYFRSLSASNEREGPSGNIGDYSLPLLGRVSMDLATFDATDLPEGLAVRGGWIELLGARVTVDDLAAFAGTIGYEVLTSLGRRYHRIYLDE